jgi:hypothetical protein
VGSVACLFAVAAVPLSRGGDAFQAAGARVAAVSFLALVAALVLGWSSLVPVAVALAGGVYALELAIDDAPLDLVAPALAVGLFLAAELGYWSLDEREPATGDAGQGLRRAAFVALLGIAAFVVAGALLALVDEVRARGLVLDLLGVIAAGAVLATVLVAARGFHHRGRRTAD